MILLESLEISFCGRAARQFLKTELDTPKTYRSVADQGAADQDRVEDCMASMTLKFPISIIAYRRGTNILTISRTCLVCQFLHVRTL